MSNFFALKLKTLKRVNTFCDHYYISIKSYTGGGGGVGGGVGSREGSRSGISLDLSRVLGHGGTTCVSDTVGESRFAVSLSMQYLM